MSLINEALKKARTAQPTGQRTAMAAGPALHPVETGGRGRNGSIFTWPFVITLVLMVASIVFWGWHRAGRVELVVRANTTPTSLNAAPVAVAPKPVVGPVIAPMVAPKPPAPAYRLDGLFFRANRPAAVINGQMVYVGSRLDEARVTAIDQDSATIVTTAGQTNVLVPAN